jgi:hypothetical protein
VHTPISWIKKSNSTWASIQPILILTATGKMGTSSNMASITLPPKLAYTNLQLCQVLESLLPICI